MDKLLLVDDEKIFLKSLKTGLKKLEHIFQTDICFSVNEAIKNINKNDYGLVITDLRMPKKDGIDLLLYLNKINFRGTSKIMSAHNTEESLKKIKHLGFIDVIAKPFDLDWFENMIVEFFKEKNSSDRNLGEVNTVIRDICRKSPDGSSIHFESIDLLSIMQVVNIDKRSATLSIDYNGNTGFVHFFEGDIVNAEYENLKIEDAILKLIETKESNISIKKLNKKVKRLIEIPFVKFVTGIIKNGKSLEEISEGETIHIVLEDKTKNIQNISKENEMNIDKLNEAVEIPKSEIGEGLLATDIFGAKDGQSIAGYNTQPAASALFNKMSDFMIEALDEAGFPGMGRYYLLDMEEEKMVIILLFGDYRWGMLIDRAKIQLGLLLNVIMPKMIKALEDAVSE